MPVRWVPPALGPRGEGWVALQMVVLVLALVTGIVGAPWPDPVRPWLGAAGVAFALAGAVLSLAAIRHLGASITPYPMPGEGAEMREHGAYRLARHPIYGGVLLVTAGWSLLSSPLALVALVTLGFVFRGKSAREELWLAERYPGYQAYRARVPRRLIPLVW
jgi:protein-S-isoprenylcysteine O-methyltransferase Ste14